MRTRRGFLKMLGLSAAAAALAPLRLAGAPDGAPLRPNIVLIMADDLGFSDVGCYGSEVATPNLDRLARRGVRFTQFHNTAKCFPSRACLLTGVYAQQCGMDRTGGEIRNAVTLGEVLRTAGYRTFMAGKHHGTENPFERGFDRYFGLRDGACNYFNPGKQREGEGKPAQKRPDRAWCIDGKTYAPYTPPEKDFYTTDYFTNHALAYLDSCKGDERPFFLYLAYNAPHDPLQAWPEDIARYRTTYMGGYAKTRDARYRKQRELGIAGEHSTLSDPTFSDWDALSEDEKREEDLTMAVYAAMIDRLDRNIGRVLAKIEELGRAENTLVLFCSDNGGSAEVVKIAGSGPTGSMTRWKSLGRDWANVSNTPYRFYKNYSHEGGICTPLIACWPAVIKDGGSLRPHAGHFVDFMATFADVSGATYPAEFNGKKIAPLQGKSLLPAFRGEAPADRLLFWQWSNGKAVRRGRWKLVSWGKEDVWELYDMELDRTETKNAAAAHPDIVAELARLHEAWREDCAKWR